MCAIKAVEEKIKALERRLVETDKEPNRLVQEENLKRIERRILDCERKATEMNNRVIPLSEHAETFKKRLSSTVSELENIASSVSSIDGRLETQ